MGEMWLSKMNNSFRRVVESLEKGEFSEPFRLGRDFAIVQRMDGGFRSRAYSLADQADEHLARGDTDKAIETYLSAIDEYPDFIHGYFKLGVAYGKVGEPQKEGESYLKAIQIEPGYKQAYYNLGALMLSVGDHRQAIQAFEKSLRLDPYQTACYVNLAGAYLAIGDRRAAIRSAQKAIEINPLLPTAYFNLGVAFGEQDPEQALEAFRMAESLDPTTPDYSISIAIALSHLGDIGEARQTLKSASERFPDHPQIRDALSKLAEVVDDAGPPARPAKEVSPDQSTPKASSALEDADSLAQQARDALGQGHLEKALNLYERAVRLKPTSGEIQLQRAWTLVAMGKLLQSQGQSERAVETWKRALRGYPDFVPALEELGREALTQGRFTATEELLAQAQRSEPNNPDLKILQSRLQFERRDLHAAFATLQTLDPARLSEPTRFKLFEQLLWLDLDEQAIELFRTLKVPPGKMLEGVNLLITFSQFDEAERYLKENPSPQGAVALGKVYSQQLRFDEAIEILTQVANRYPEAWSAHQFLGTVYVDSGQAEKAVQSFREALRGQPGNVNLLIHLGTASAQAGRVDEAIQWLEQARELSPGSYKVNFELGQLLLEEGDLDSAQKRLLDVLKVEPDHIRTHYLLGRLYQKKADPVQAREYLQRFNELKQQLEEDRANLLGLQNELKQKQLFKEL